MKDSDTWSFDPERQIQDLKPKQKQITARPKSHVEQIRTAGFAWTNEQLRAITISNQWLEFSTRRSGVQSWN